MPRCDKRPHWVEYGPPKMISDVQDRRFMQLPLAVSGPARAMRKWHIRAEKMPLYAGDMLQCRPAIRLSSILPAL